MTTDGEARPAPQTSNGPSDPILDQAFDADSLYALRAAAAAHATRAGLAPGRADDLVIAVHELAANAVRHGAGHGRLRIWRSDQALRCEITDDGHEPAHEPAPEQRAPEQRAPEQRAPEQHDPQWRVEPGHGLSLVRQVADQTSLSNGPAGTMATISFALAPPGPPFGLTRHETDGCTVLTLTGPLDHASASQFTQAIRDEPWLILDLSALTGWDSVGLAALITAQHRAEARQARLILAGLPEQLRNHPAIANRFTHADNASQAAQILSEP